MERPIIFDFFDYREFLKEMFEWVKIEDPSFSHRKFSKKAGFSSSSVLTQIINAQSGLSDEGVEKVGKGFSLKPDEIRFLLKLVKYDRAENLADRQEIYETIIKDKKFASRHPLAPAQFRYYTKWYYPLIREIILMGAETLDEIKSAICFDLPLSELELALRDLLSINLIQQKDGKFSASNQLVIAEDDKIPGLAASYHEEMIEQAKQAIKNIQREKRDIRAATMSIDSDLLPQFRSFLQQTLIDAIQRFEEMSQNKDMIFQLNIQAFPLFEKK